MSSIFQPHHPIHSLFMISFLWPKTWLLYTVSGVLGLCAAIIWTAQGSFLSRCSEESTISRNSGIFWAMLQMRLVLESVMEGRGWLVTTINDHKKILLSMLFVFKSRVNKKVFKILRGLKKPLGFKEG